MLLYHPESHFLTGPAPRARAQLRRRLCRGYIAERHALLGWVGRGGVVCAGGRIVETAPAPLPATSHLGGTEGGREGGARDVTAPSFLRFLHACRCRGRLALHSMRAIHDAGHCSLVSERAGNLLQKVEGSQQATYRSGGATANEGKWQPAASLVLLLWGRIQRGKNPLEKPAENTPETKF